MGTILILGRNGQVGWELCRTLACLGRAAAVDYPAVDFTQAESLRAVVAAHDPAVIVNAAAYTAVDKAESEADLAMAINGTAPAVLAEEARRRGALLMHYSTDYVYDGTGTRPWLETDATEPRNVYGRTKLAGDEAIQASGCEHLIFRTSWVYGARGNNFLLTMLRLAKEKAELGIVADQIGAPTGSECIAQATAAVLAQAQGRNLNGRSGVYHLVNGGETSWHGFAEAIFARAEELLQWPRPVLRPLTTSEYPRPAARPSNSRLNGEKLTAAFGVRLPEWPEALELVLEKLAQGVARL